MTPFTYYTIIGRDPSLLEGHLKNVTDYAGFNKLECEKKLLVVIYKNDKIPDEVTKEILTVCDKYNADYVIYDEPDNNFLTNLYESWNLGYKHALDGFVFRGGSDQVFSKDSFLTLYKGIKINKDKKIVLQANTIENGERNMGSRHILAYLGNTFEDFKYDEFEKLIEEINSNDELKKLDLVDIETALRVWNHPTSFQCQNGYVNRCDGCSWLMSKQEWQKYGPLPAVEDGHTGDVVIHDRMQRDGYQQFIVKNCVTYHFVRGESGGVTQ
jgi:hypothetical protein